ncbi:hypothetical protein OKW34_003771 [Paraburkholderia youngii]
MWHSNLYVAFQLVRPEQFVLPSTVVTGIEAEQVGG